MTDTTFPALNGRALADDTNVGAPTPDLDLLERDEAAGEEVASEPSSTLALFAGDDGGLDLGQRKALVALLKQRFISARTDGPEWRALVENPRPIQARLNDLFMELHLDTEREVAYKRQVTPEGGGRFPTLLHDIAWGREDTLLLVYLRDRFRGEQAAGNDRVYVDRDDMLEFIAAHRPDRATDQASDAKRAGKAIETVYKSGLLLGPSAGDRFEIPAAIEVLLSMEKLHELLAWVREQNAGAGANGTTDDDSVLPDAVSTPGTSTASANTGPESEN
jgi:hypothetical protein